MLLTTATTKGRREITRSCVPFFVYSSLLSLLSTDATCAQSARPRQSCHRPVSQATDRQNRISLRVFSTLYEILSADWNKRPLAWLPWVLGHWPPVGPPLFPSLYSSISTLYSTLHGRFLEGRWDGSTRAAQDNTSLNTVYYRVLTVYLYCLLADNLQTSHHGYADRQLARYGGSSALVVVFD